MIRFGGFLATNLQPFHFLTTARLERVFFTSIGGGMPHRSNSMHNDAAITAATRTTEAGALAGFLGWAAQVNWIGWIGVAVAVAGYLTNLYFQRKRFRMQKEEHDARMARILEKRDERKETSQGN